MQVGLRLARGTRTTPVQDHAWWNPNQMQVHVITYACVKKHDHDENRGKPRKDSKTSPEAGLMDGERLKTRGLKVWPQDRPATTVT